MPSLSKPIVKICGLTRPQDATLAAILGADFCGFVFHPDSPRAIGASQGRIMPTPGAQRVGVFVNHSIAETQAIMEEAALDLAQLHGNQAPEVALALGPERVIKVFWPERQPPDELAQQMDLWKGLAVYFLFDSGKEGGGSGRPINATWPVSPKPYLLAGGLDPDSARAAWLSADPMLAGFDFNSALEEGPGIKDPDLLRAVLPWR
ncbi:MAG: phosphoribosylanthranilate isomerase [Deltaproteobacteria bacterium]|jgi:phosphoribosylanthranilate isomerase|nr:phosphoribosylanthranilate isomerase [Deltaproteobacteria bacterium]